MKTQFQQLLLFALILISMALSASTQFLVKVRPSSPPVALVPPHRPSPSHFWVDGSWIWQGGHYILIDGYWLTPRSGYYWRNGY